jgi:uncharacterized protein YegP (UPF0339 family)
MPNGTEQHEQRLVRPQYFNRQVVKDSDLNAAVHYSHHLMQRHQVLLHGWGVVVGLEVSVTPLETGDIRLNITPGTALSPQGATIVVNDAVQMDIDCATTPTQDCRDLRDIVLEDRTEETRVYICIRYDENDCDPQPGLPDYCAGQPNYAYTRLRDTYAILCLDERPDSVTPEKLYQQQYLDRLINGFYNPVPPELMDTLATPSAFSLPQSPWLVLATLVYIPQQNRWVRDYSERLEVLTQPRIQSLIGWAIGASMTLAHPDYRYQMYVDRAEEYRWRLLQRTTILADSAEGFSTREECLAEIELMKLTARGALVQDLRDDRDASRVINGCYFQIYDDAEQEIRWRFKQGDFIIADSGEGYDREERFLRDFHMMRRIVGGARITDYTQNAGTQRGVREVSGIGDVYATRLARTGINNLAFLSIADAREVSVALDVPLMTARRFITEANNLIVDE